VNPKFLIAVVVSLGLASPALARNYYIVQNSKTDKCSILPKKPKGKIVAVLNGSAIYKTRTEAQAALGTFAACKP
jgi:hypothetical protein